MRLLLFGAPGSGKGTQGALLAAHSHVPHIASGDLIRDHIERHTEFGRRVEEAIAHGNFAPNEDVLFWVCRRLAEADARHGYILDGFPRDLAQAQAFDADPCHGDSAFDAAVELRISEEALVERLGGRLVCPRCDAVYHVHFSPPQRAGICDHDGTSLVRRPDDAPDALRHRLKVYETRTLPLHDYYDAQGLLCVVDASGSADEVFTNILSALNIQAGKRRTAPLGV